MHKQAFVCERFLCIIICTISILYYRHVTSSHPNHVRSAYIVVPHHPIQNGRLAGKNSKPVAPRDVAKRNTAETTFSKNF